MALRNIKRYVQAVRQNKGVLKTDQIELTGRATAPTDSDLSSSHVRIYGDTALNQFRGYINGTWTNLGGAGGAGVSTWDELYDLDKTLDVDSTAFILNGTVVLGANNVLTIVNAGTGKDIAGPAWSLISTGAVGILELTSGGTINATGGALTIGSVATDTTFAGGTIVTVDETITGTAAATVFTITAGDVLISDGSISLTDADEAASITIVNNTAAAVNVVDINADAIGAGGVLLHLDSLAAGMSTGKFIECFDGAAAAFSVALYGATTIAGAAANNVFVITAGDAVMSDGSLTITDADDAATLSITNNANVGTNASQVAIAGSGTYVGNTTKAFVSITASGLTTGTGVYVPFAAMTTGKGIHTYAAALTTGSLVYINQDGEALAAGELLTIDNTESGTLTAKTGNLCSISSSMTETAASRTEDYDTLLISRTDISNLLAITYTATGSLLKLSKTSTQTLGTLTDSVIGLEVSMPALCTGAGVSVTHAAATGSCFVGANDATTTGIGGLSLTHTTAVITTGSVAKISSTSVDTGTGQGTLVDLVSSGAAAATIVKLTTAALDTGSAFQVVANALTTGKAIDVQHTTAVITTGSVAKISSTSIDTGTGQGTLLDLVSSGTTAGLAVKLTTAGITGGTAMEINAAALTTGTGLLITSAGVMTTTGELLSLVGNAATTCTGLLRISGTALTSGFVAELTGGGATATSAGGVLNLAAGASTDGAALSITTSGIYVGTVGVVDVNAAAATTGVIVDIGGAGLTSGTAVKINATQATLTTGKYIDCYDGAATDFSVARYGAVTIAGLAATTVLTVTAGDLVMSDGAIGVANEAVTIAAAATTFAADSNLVTVTGDAGGNTVATITGGVSGQLLTLIFVDALVTITDNNTHAANSVDLSAAFTSADDTVLELIFDGTSWYEVSRSVN